ncbi:hypothetical protein ABMY26_22630 [Azospirillum sp. HJ39]|uniref:hypothetical protein n=1 Tax=Azospirillum sp. HJ39 TaxID=3159496 RepID=UPI003558F852
MVDEAFRPEVVVIVAACRQLGRHKSYETTRRYLRIAEAAARQTVEGATMASLRVGTGSAYTQEFHAAPIDDESAPDGAGKEKALEPLGSKAFPLPSEMVGATGFEPATLRPPDLRGTAKVLKLNKRRVA